MKKNKLFGLALLATMASFTACSNDTEDLLVQECEIKLTSEIEPTSRVASLDYQSTQIVKGQIVGITIENAKTEHKNVSWTVGDNGKLTNTSNAVYYGDGTATITAYHPYNKAWTNTNHEFSVDIDQSLETDYLESDLLWATASSSKTNTVVSLKFYHKLAKINVTLVPEKTGDKLNDATISICNTKISTTFNPTTGGISAATGETKEIIAAVTANDVYTASAIVVPQAVNGKFIKIVYGGKTYYYTLNSAMTLESGHSYSYTLTVKGKQLISTKSTIEPWVNTSNTGAAEEDDANNIATIPNNEIWYTTSDGNIINPVNNVFGANLRYNFYENGKGIITFDDDVTSFGDPINSYSIPFIENCSSLTSITLPNSVTSIGFKAFYGCSSLTSITIPNSVTSIASDAFMDCSSLTSIVVEQSNSAYDSREKCNAIIESSTNKLVIGCKNTIIPNSVVEIGAAAFNGNTSLTNITIPSNVTVIGQVAFARCSSLTRVNVKAQNPPTLGNFTFNNCSNELKIYVPANSLEAYKENWSTYKNNIVAE